jgi:hypothetical protein
MNLSSTVVGALIGAVATLLVGLLVHQRELRKFLRERSVEGYLAVWEQLAKLKQDIDALWEKADHPRLNRFIDRLQETKLLTEQKSILISPADFKQLEFALKKLGDYEHGKKRLVDYRQHTSGNEIQYDLVPGDCDPRKWAGTRGLLQNNRGY